MNLLDKLTHFIKPGLALLLVPFFFACDDPTQLGLQVDSNESNINVEKVELTLPTSTIYIDSLRTDKLSATAFGVYEDSIIGKVTATSYSQYNIYTGVLPGNDSLDFYSAEITLKISDGRAHGPLVGQRMTIHEINDTIYSQPVYLSNRVLDYKPDPIAEFTFDFNPEIDSVLTIPLNDDFGKKLFLRLEKAALNQTYQDSLLQGLYHDPPLAFVPDPNNTGLLKFNLAADTVGLNIYMISARGVKYFFKYTLDKDASYTQITRDRSTGKLADIVSEYTPSGIPSSRSYLDIIAGIFPKVSLAPFISFLDSNKNYIINKATLQYGLPAINNQPYVYEIPILLNFFIKPNGRINGSSIVNPQSQDGYHNALLSNATYTQVLSQGTYYKTTGLLTMGYDTTNYSGDATMFTQFMSSLATTESDLLTEELVIYGQNNLFMGQSSFVNSEMKLILYYTTVKE